MTTNKIELKINEKARSYAGIYASMIEDEYQRKRANAAIIALFSYAELLKKSKSIDIQNAMTLYRNPKLCENYELADFYVNNYHLDVRVTTEDDKVLVPKIHYDCNIIPDFYVVIKMDKSLKTAEFLGVIDTSLNEPEPSDFHYYLFNSQNFMSNEDFQNQIINKKQVDLSDNEHENFQDNYLGFIDNEISSQTKIELLRHLFKCSECRTEFCCFTGFEMVNCHAANYPDLFTDKTLEIVGAQLVDDEKYEGREETLYFDDINTEESLDFELEDIPSIEAPQKISEISIAEENVQNIHEETVPSDNDGDILDELFSDDGKPAQKEEEIQLITDENDDLTVIKEDDNMLSDENLSNSEKVIIDYDEHGEPVYSYMTDTKESEIQNIDDSELLIEEDNQELNLSEDDLNFVDNKVNEPSEEIDIMDQMFKDGALEREKIEQQDLSYNRLDTEQITQENIPLEIENEKDFNSNENKIDTIQPEIIENPVENIKQSEIEPFEVSETTEGKTVDVQNNQIDEQIEIKEDKIQEDEIIEGQTVSDNEPKNSSVQMFDGYIESEILNKNEEFENEYEEYDDEGYDETDYEIDYEKGQKSSKKAVIVTISIIAILLLILSMGAIFYIKNKNTQESNKVQNEITKVENNQNIVENDLPIQNTNINEEETSSVKLEIPMMPSVEQNPPEIPSFEDKPDTVQPTVKEDIKKDSNVDINKAITNALSSSNLVTLKGINWFCNAELYNDSAFKNYMQNLDNTLKQNLKNNIMQITEIPVLKEVTVKFAIDNNRNLRKSLITESSGSSEVDKIVLQSLNETFEGEKSPILTDSPLKSDMYYFKVVIKL